MAASDYRQDPNSLLHLLGRPQMEYWATIPPTGVMLGLAGGAIGAAIIAAQRSVLTTGVMIVLSLVPSMAVAGLGVAALDFGLAAQGLLRWVVDAICVLTGGTIVLALKRAILRRNGVPTQISY